MIIIIKKPGLSPEISEATSIMDINKLVGNVDSDGNGLNRGGSDIRMSIGDGIDMYVKENAINNFELGENMWGPNDNFVLFGTIVFAGYSSEVKENSGACSLTQEQIDYCLSYIEKQKVEEILLKH